MTLNQLNNPKKSKKEKKIYTFFKSLILSTVKLNDLEAISR